MLVELEPESMRSSSHTIRSLSFCTQATCVQNAFPYGLPERLIDQLYLTSIESPKQERIYHVSLGHGRGVTRQYRNAVMHGTGI